jgi:hypothetical protein
MHQEGEEVELVRADPACAQHRHRKAGVAPRVMGLGAALAVHGRLRNVN